MTETYGDMSVIACPYCGHGNYDLWDCTHNQFDTHEGDSLQCADCNKVFIVSRHESCNDLQARPMEDGWKSPPQRFGEDVERMMRLFEQHTLVCDLHTKCYRSFRVKHPEYDTMMGFLVIESPEGLTLIGDWVPKRHGCNSDRGYGIGWFSGSLSADYLCEKFADIEPYTPEHARLVVAQRTFRRLYKKIP